MGDMWMNLVEVVWANKGPGTIEGGGHSDDAKPVRQSTTPLGYEGDCHEVPGED
jgi:hypothetical protein